MEKAARWLSALLIIISLCLIGWLVYVKKSGGLGIKIPNLGQTIGTPVPFAQALSQIPGQCKQTLFPQSNNSSATQSRPGPNLEQTSSLFKLVGVKLGGAPGYDVPPEIQRFYSNSLPSKSDCLVIFMIRNNKQMVVFENTQGKPVEIIADKIPFEELVGK